MDPRREHWEVIEGSPVPGTGTGLRKALGRTIRMERRNAVAGNRKAAFMGIKMTFMSKLRADLSANHYAKTPQLEYEATTKNAGFPAPAVAG